MAIKARRGKLYPPIEIQEGLALGLDDIEWERIVDRLGRAPNFFECSIFAALWSEAVSNKSTTALLEAIERKMPQVSTIPGSQLGLIKINEGEYVTLRIVQNNAQSMMEPYYGVQTAINFAVEELVAAGATPLGLFTLLRFGSYELIKNQRLFQGTAEGIGAFGSKYGIPVLGGDLYFHESYNQGAMTNGAIVGHVKTDFALGQEEVPFQSPILYVGAKTGKEGLNYKKKSEDEEDPLASKKTPQQYMKVSDPLLSNRIISATAEAIEQGVLREVVNIGNGGLAVTCFELAKRVNRPVLLDIDRIPLRVEGLDPLEIVLSETSGRILMVTTKDKHRALNQILHKWDLDSVKVGEVNDSDGIEFYWNHYLAADIPFQFALGGSVQKTFDVVKFPPMLKRSEKADDTANKARKRKRKVVDEWSLIREAALAKQQQEEERELECPRDLDDVWLDLLADPNLCSRNALYGLFDQVIGARTYQRAGGDCAVLRLSSVSKNGNGNGSSLSEAAAEAAASAGAATKRGLALTVDSNSLYVSKEPYLGTVQTIAEGMRNLAATGARPLALAYCMNFGDPDRYEDVCDLSESIRGLGDATKIWEIPLLSRQISLNNGTEGNPTLPTPAVFMAGLIQDLGKSCSIGFRRKGDTILLLGLTRNEIGCTEYSSFFHKFVNRMVPDIEFETEKKTCELVVELIEGELLQSAHDLSIGGLAVALTESCMFRGRPIGAEFHIDPQEFDSPNGPIPLRPDAALFSETSARFLVSCKAENEDKVRSLCEEAGVPVTGQGKVGGRMIRVEGAAESELPLSTTYKLWIHRLESLLGQGGDETVGF